MFTKTNPAKLIIYWLSLIIVAGVVVIPILFATNVGGEQKPLTFLGYLWLTAVYGTLILSVVTPILYLSWFKKYWYVNLLFFSISGYYVIKNHNRNVAVDFSFNEKTEVIDNKEIKTVKEYYSFDPEKIRSVSYWQDGKKDSIWTVYSEDGSVIQQKRYKLDSLVEKIK